MAVFSMSDLRVLAHAISTHEVRRNRGAKGLPSKHAIRAELITLGTRATDNWRFFTRLMEGCGVSAKGAENASKWFCENWPPDLSWPEDVPDLRSFYPRKPPRQPLLPDLEPSDSEAA